MERLIKTALTRLRGSAPGRTLATLGQGHSARPALGEVLIKLPLIAEGAPARLADSFRADRRGTDRTMTVVVHRRGRAPTARAGK